MGREKIKSSEIDRLRFLFESITCLCWEGAEFTTKIEMAQAITTEAIEGIRRIDEIKLRVKGGKE